MRWMNLYTVAKPVWADNLHSTICTNNQSSRTVEQVQSKIRSGTWSFWDHHRAVLSSFGHCLCTTGPDFENTGDPHPNLKYTIYTLYLYNWNTKMMWQVWITQHQCAALSMLCTSSVVRFFVQTVLMMSCQHVWYTLKKKTTGPKQHLMHAWLHSYFAVNNLCAMFHALRQAEERKRPHKLLSHN